MSYDCDLFKLKSVSLTLPLGFDIREFSHRAYRDIEVDHPYAGEYFIIQAIMSRS